MSTIAVELDAEEMKLFGSDMNEGLKKGQTSHNVANDGNFSIQVIQKALH